MTSTTLSYRPHPTGLVIFSLAAALAGCGGSGASTGTVDAPACPAGTIPTGGRMISGFGNGTADGGYTYNFYTNGQGSASMTVYGVDAEFSATWTNPGDFLARVG